MDEMLGLSEPAQVTEESYQQLGGPPENRPKRSMLDMTQTVFDAFGMWPVIGEPFDLASGVISAFRGDWKGASLSLGAMVPLFGDAAGAAKLARRVENGVEASADLADIGSDVIRGGGRLSDANKVENATGSAIDVENAVVKSGDDALSAASDLPKGFDPAKGFSSFDDFKKAFGDAGPEQAWHHIVEQTINSGKFAPELLHNPANLLNLPHGKGTIHAKLSGFYSSKRPFTGGLTVREWLSKQSFKEQFEFGIQKIKDFGGSDYLPTGLR